MAYGGTGGDGGNYYGTASGNGAAGGAATATANGTNTGTYYNDTVSATAYGGNGGNGGDATATATGTSNGYINVTANARGGVSLGTLLDGSATARATATGSSGGANSSAFSGGGATVSVSAAAMAPIASTSVSESRAAAGRAFPSLGLAAGLQSTAYVMGMPMASDVTAAVVGNPRAASMAAGADNLGLVLLGGNYSNSGSGSSQTYLSSASFTIDLSQLSSLKDLQLALIDGAASGTGFDSLHLQVDREGLTIIDTTFNSLPSALGYFHDSVFNLGDIEAGITDNILDFAIRLSLTTDDANAGFNSLFILSNSPLAALAGDYNGSGKVDAADYTVWRNTLGTTDYGYPADADRSGGVDQVDYNIWKAHFGETSPSGSGALALTNSVPEPTGLFAALLATLFEAAAVRLRRAQS